MSRAVLIVLDSVGVGGAPDASAYGDAGANTLGHIAEACASGRGDREGLRSGPLLLPHLGRLGFGAAAQGASGSWPANLPAPGRNAIYGHAAEVSNGKDTPSGHWEIAAVPVPFDWGYFPETEPCFPAELTDAIVREGKVPGILGNKHASGTTILAELGEEHIRSGKPIGYTSADSVFQIAAHESHFGLERLYALCETVRRLVDPYSIGRVIARPFIGETAETFERTGNRRDYAVPPPEPTLLDRVISAGGRTLAIGKIGDIFAHKGISDVNKASGNAALTDATLAAMEAAKDGDLVFANLVDFDMLYGHRRDVPGYAAALEAFDARLPEIEAALRPGDLVVITADHGCDPTWRGTDHTREQVPILAFGRNADGTPMPGKNIGARKSFADIGETVAAHLGLAPGRHGRSLL
ncbi:phosphopentomutase [Kaistia terrae]|uniref:Phosphopentomutase n=1 Tax=Kaistia terrae TaxID=537017 RepID=A0ABW0Q2L5_9HYPH|nr:phosphopentomutase [Kaistia terrae]MCX5581613.1 phosphopentomutase [Kaistia terrae]